MFSSPPFPPQRVAMVLLALLMSACSTTGPIQPGLPEVEERPGSAADYLEQEARRAGDLSREQVLLAAGESAMADLNGEAAAELLDMLQERLDGSGEESGLRMRSLLLEADLLLYTDEPAAALRALNTLPAPRWQAQSETLYRQWLEQRVATLLELDEPMAAVRDLIALQDVLTGEQRTANRNRIWETLSTIPTPRLEGVRVGADSYELQGWLELVAMTRSHPDNIEDQIAVIERWKNRWNQHSAADVLPDALGYLVELWENRPGRLALLLPLQQTAGNAVAQGFMGAYYHALEQGLDVPEVRLYDTSDAATIPDQYRQAVEDGAQLIIGPLDKEAVRALQRRNSLPVATLALNYTDNNLIGPEGFYQFGLAPEDDIRQLTRTARQQNHRLAAALTPAGSEYDRIRNLFHQQWQQAEGAVIGSGTFIGTDSYSSVLRQLLSIDDSQARADRLTSVLPRQEVAFIPRRRQDIDYLFLMASPEQGRQIAPTLDFFYAGDVPIYAMPAIHDGGAEPSRNRDLEGILFTDLPWLLDEDRALKTRLDTIWPSASGAVQRLRALGVDSFRLYARLGQLVTYPDTRMQGATGTLALQGNGVIQRIVPVARFSGGVAVRTSADDAAVNLSDTAGR